MADQTKSGIPTRMWTIRILYCQCELEKKERGFLFARDNGRKAIIGDYDPMLRNLLDQGRKMKLELFTTGVFIGESILGRIPRHGEITEAENNNVSTASMKLINRWRKRESARGTEAGLSMRQVCTQVSISIVASLHIL